MKRSNVTTDAASEASPSGSVPVTGTPVVANRGASVFGEGILPWESFQDGHFGKGSHRQDVEATSPVSVYQAEYQVAAVPARLSDEPLQGTLGSLPQASVVQRRQELENEQYVVLGRLTAHLCHSINNSLQALRGALTLALEEPDVPPVVVDFIRLCQVEAQREAIMVDRIRQVYRPNGDTRAVDLQALLDDVVAMTADEAQRLGVEVRQEVTTQTPLVRGSGSKLRLIFLSLVLRVMDMAVMSGRKGLRLRAATREADLMIELCLDGSPAGEGDEEPWTDAAPDALEGQCALSAIQDLARSQGAALGILPGGRDIGIWVTLPR